MALIKKIEFCNKFKSHIISSGTLEIYQDKVVIKKDGGTNSMFDVREASLNTVYYKDMKSIIYNAPTSKKVSWFDMILGNSNYLGRIKFMTGSETGEYCPNYVTFTKEKEEEFIEVYDLLQELWQKEKNKE